MPSPRNGLIKARVEVNWVSSPNLAPIQNALDDDLEDLARNIEAKAQASSLFVDRTGKLRSKIRMKRHSSGYGFIVEVRWNSAHLVEFGHDIVTSDGRIIGHVRAYPFLRTAEEEALREYMSIRAFGSAGVMAA